MGRGSECVTGLLIHDMFRPTVPVSARVVVRVAVGKVCANTEPIHALTLVLGLCGHLHLGIEILPVDMPIDGCPRWHKRCCHLGCVMPLLRIPEAPSAVLHNPGLGPAHEEALGEAQQVLVLMPTSGGEDVQPRC